MRRSSRQAAFLAAALVSATACARAQSPRRSQLGTVTQTIAATRVEVIYRRPVARGRTLFGSLVPWGRIWTPSADTAVVISFSTPVEIAGSRLGAGTYSLWAIPDSSQWTFVFTTDHPVFHLAYREGHDALRVQVTPKEGEHMETLAFYFPVVDADSAVLNLHWGRTVVPLSIRSR